MKKILPAISILLFVIAHPAGNAAPPQENWNSLTLEGSHLKTAEVLKGAPDDYPTYTYEMTQIMWRAADPIYAHCCPK